MEAARSALERASRGSMRNEPESRGVPLLDLSRQHAPLKAEILTAMEKVCDSGKFVLGPDVDELEGNLAAYCQAGHAVACASGSDALLLALMVLKIGPGDEVILPSFTFFATASAITRLGATPVFADIDSATFNVAPEQIESLVSPRTKAIVPVHLFGQCANMTEIGRVGQAAGIAIVEDLAQAVGAEWAGRRAGSMGAIGCLSFYPTKNLGGAGDGGMLTTNDDLLADKLRVLRVHGMRPRYYHHVVGINSRLDSFQAAVLNIKFRHLDSWIDLRRENASRYTELFSEANLDRILGLPACGTNHRHVWNQYVVRVPDGRRDALRQHLAGVKISTEIYYPLGLHRQECFAYLGYRPGDLPETDRAAREVLALPIFPELTAEEQEFVVEQIAAFFVKPNGGHALAGPKYLHHPTARRPGTRSPR